MNDLKISKSIHQKSETSFETSFFTCYQIFAKSNQSFDSSFDQSKNQQHFQIQNKNFAEDLL